MFHSYILSICNLPTGNCTVYCVRQQKRTIDKQTIIWSLRFIYDMIKIGRVCGIAVVDAKFEFVKVNINCGFGGVGVWYTIYAILPNSNI